jgi:citrate lyase gamma subunit
MTMTATESPPTDARRITEADPDFVRLKAKTARQLAERHDVWMNHGPGLEAHGSRLQQAADRRSAANAKAGHARAALEDQARSELSAHPLGKALLDGKTVTGTMEGRHVAIQVDHSNELGVHLTVHGMEGAKFGQIQASTMRYTSFTHALSQFTGTQVHDSLSAAQRTIQPRATRARKAGA